MHLLSRNGALRVSGAEVSVRNKEGGLDGPVVVHLVEVVQRLRRVLTAVSPRLPAAVVPHAAGASAQAALRTASRDS